MSGVAIWVSNGDVRSNGRGPPIDVVDQDFCNLTSE
jgi:hypothetical protein